MIAISFVLSLLGAATPAASPANQLEMVIQRGHGRTIEGGVLFGAGDSAGALTADGDDIRVWSRDVRGLDRWQLKRVFPNAVEFTFMEMRTPGTVDHIYVQSAHGSELFRVGDWATPLLGTGDGFPPRTQIALYIRPEASGENWYGLFVQERGDADGDGYSDEWRAFSSRDGVRWGRSAPPGLKGRISSVARLAKATFAVRHGDAAGSGWSIFRFDGNAWRPVEVGEAPERITNVNAVREGFLVEMSADGQRKSWFVRQPNGSWQPIGKTLPLGNAGFSEVRSPGNGFLGVRWTEAEGDQPLTWSWFQGANDGKFRALAEVIPGAPERVVSAAWALDGHAVLLRAAGSRLAERPAPSLFIEDGSRGWRPASDILPGCGKVISSIQGFAGERGIGVLEAPEPEPAENEGSANARTAPQRSGAANGRKGAWRWYLRDSAGAWQPLEAVLPGCPDDVMEVQSSDPAHVLGLKLPLDGGSRWRYFLYGDGGWKPVEAYLPGTADLTGLGGSWRDGLLTANDRSGARRWFRRGEDGNWVDLGSTIGPVAPDVRATAALPAVRRAIPMGDHAVELEPANGGSGRRLLQDGAGVWREVTEGIGGEGASSGTGDVVTIRGCSGEDHLIRQDDGSWVPLQQVIPLVRGKVRTVYRFLGRRGMAVQFDAESVLNRESPWKFFYRSDRGSWVELHRAVPGMPRHALVAYSLADDDGIVVEEAGDSNGNGRPGEWLTFFRDGKSWKELHALVPGLPPNTQARSFASGAGLELQVENDTGVRVLHYLRDASAHFRRLADAIPGAPPQFTALESFWGQHGLCFRAASGDQRETWDFFAKSAKGAWLRLEVPTPPARIRAVRGDERLGILALQGADGAWSVYLAAGEARVTLLDHPKAGLPRVSDLRLFPEARRVALRAEMEPGQPERWIWLAPKGAGSVDVIGETGGPDWFGLGWMPSGDGISLVGAMHYLDGHPTARVPRPVAWFHRDARLDGSGQVYRAPSLVPADIDHLGTGPDGVVAVYRQGGSVRAVAVGSGTLEVVRVPLRKTDGSRRELMLLRNRLPDGTSRLYRFDDPSKFILFYEDPGMPGREGWTHGVFYDERGYFYAATDRLTEVMTFRRGNDVLGFDQLSAVLFRPDMLEERLGLAADEHLFELTGADLESIRKAKARTEGDTLDVRALEPPRLTIGKIPAVVSQPRVHVDFEARFGLATGARALARVLGATPGATPIAVATRQEMGPLPFASTATGFDLPLLEGNNVVEMTVWDGHDLSTTRRVTVRYQPPAPEKHDLYLAVVGVRRYADQDVGDLLSAPDDALAAVRAFRAQEGRTFAKVHVAAFCDPVKPTTELPCRPTSRQEILDGVRQHFAHVHPGDYAVLYVVGHGMSKEAGQYFFLPGDGQSRTPKMMLDFSTLRGLLFTPGKPGRRLLILDTCQSASMARVGEQRRTFQQAAERDAVFILAATAGDSFAYEVPEIGNGVFTFALAEALSGRATRSTAGGRLMLGELNRYLADRVPQIASRLLDDLGRPVQQVPQFPPVPEWLDHEIAQVEAVRSRVALEVQRGGTTVESLPWLRLRWRLLLESIPGVRVVDDGEKADQRVSVRVVSNATLEATVRSVARGRPADRRGRGSESEVMGTIRCAIQPANMGCTGALRR